MERRCFFFLFFFCYSSFCCCCCWTWRPHERSYRTQCTQRVQINFLFIFCLFFCRGTIDSGRRAPDSERNGRFIAALASRHGKSRVMASLGALLSPPATRALVNNETGRSGRFEWLLENTTKRAHWTRGQQEHPSDIFSFFSFAFPACCFHFSRGPKNNEKSALPVYYQRRTLVIVVAPRWLTRA